MRDRLADLGDAAVVMVLFTRQRNLRGYRARFVAPLTVVTDERRDVYRAFGIPVDESADETAQLGGDFVVGADGHVVYARVQRSAGDRPSVDELVGAVERGR